MEFILFAQDAVAPIVEWGNLGANGAVIALLVYMITVSNPRQLKEFRDEMHIQREAHKEEIRILSEAIKQR